MARFQRLYRSSSVGCCAVDLGEGQQLAHQPVEGPLERVDRTLETLQEEDTNEADHLFLAVLFERIDAVVWSDVVGKRVVDGQRKERIRLLERPLEHVEGLTVGLADGVLRHLRWSPHRKVSGLITLLELAGLGVGAAALHDQRLEDLVCVQHFTGLFVKAVLQRSRLTAERDLQSVSPNG